MSLKEAYQDKMEAQLKAWSAEIDALTAKAEQAAAAKKLEYYQMIDSVRVQQEAAQQKLHAFKAASEGAWEDLKAGMEMAWDELKQAVENAASKCG